MTAITISRKILRIIAIIAGFLVGIMVSFHFWFINHAEELLSELVTEQSNGKLALQVEKFRFNWFGKKMELKKAVFYTTNDSIAPNGYRIEVDQLQLRLKALYPVVAEKRFLIDSLKLINPVIIVTNYRAGTHVKDTNQKHASLAQEMGKVYNSIRDALKVLEVDRFIIGNGKFTLVNKINPLTDTKPVTISNIDMRLDNLRVDSAQGTSQQKILFSDNVSLRTNHQNIDFPDGRHRLSFSNFRINLQHRLAEFDSCTITARKGDSDSSSFTVFFDKLKMTNIDFDTLYRAEVIKADSVYCVNPRFMLNVNLREGGLSGPRLDDILLQLTGDLHLKFAVVENGSFDINIKRKGRPSSFVSDHNNFEVQGLRVLKSSHKPVTVERFAMAIRNYENFLRDSSLSIQFDSILLYGNRVSLANFVFREYKSGNPNNKIGMPQFELYGLSWDDLVFSHYVKAERLVLYKPIINYTIRPKSGKRADVFGALREVNRLLQLNNLNIIDGQVNLDFASGGKLQLNNVTSLISVKRLVNSKNITSLRDAVNTLMFTDGIFTLKELVVNIKDAVVSNTENQLQAGAISVSEKNKLAIQGNNVRITSLKIDDTDHHLTINGLSWNRGSVRISSTGAHQPASLPVTINDLKAANTNLNIHSGKGYISMFVETMTLGKLTNKEKVWTTEQLTLTGHSLVGKKDKNTLSIGRFKLADAQLSQLQDLSYITHKQADSIHIRIPAIKILTDISRMISGRLYIQSLEIAQPVIQAHITGPEDDEDENTTPWPKLDIEKLRVHDPTVHATIKSPKGNSLLKWDGREANFIELHRLTTDSSELHGIKAASLSFFLDGFLFRNAKGKMFETKSGNINATLENLSLRRNDAGNWDWKGKLDNLEANHFVFDSIDRNGGRLDISAIKLNYLYISSQLLLNMYELVKRNASFTLRGASGSYQNKQNRFSWHDIQFNKNTHELVLDSFSFIPIQSREEFMRSKTYQTDYAQLKIGAVTVKRANLERFLKDTVIELGTISINNASLDDFRDKRLPREPGVIKPLPVKHLAKLPVKLMVDSILIRDANVRYGEFNDKTDAAGWINVKRLNGLITNIRNHNTTSRDSLAIAATAFLEDSLFTALQVKGSYMDTAQGFLMKVQMGDADLRVLNDALGPLAGASLKSGMLDTMTMIVKGNDQLAYGEMLMVYRDLKVTISGKPNEEKKSFLKGALNSIVNTILKNKNTDRKGVVFFVRLQDRSALNYLVKTTLSGVGSSAGLGKNKRQLKRFMKRKEKAIRRNNR